MAKRIPRSKLLKKLDDPRLVARVDASSLREYLSEFPEQIIAAESGSRAVKLPPKLRGMRHVVLVGMGGSGIGWVLWGELGANS